MTPPVPAELTGLWRREAITAPGFRDATTQVLWLQTATWYADLRVPADRPGPRAPAGFAAYPDAELAALAAIQGFAGELAAADGVCLWRRDFDRQPPGPLPDEARFRFDGPDVMVEDGVHADYQEIWRRVDGSAGPLAAFRRAGADGAGGLLVVAGRHLMEVRPRAGRPPGGASLAEAVQARLAAGDRAGACGLLDMQIRYAVQGADGWRVRLSSHPWLEGALMWRPQDARFDAAGGRLRLAGGETWELLDGAAEGEALGRLLAGAAPAQA